MTEQEIICKAMNGGYIPEGGIKKEWNPEIENIQDCADLNISDCVLDPKFWIAVGKEEKWEEKLRVATLCDNCKFAGITEAKPEWQHKMHQMIDHLVAGKSIEDFISTL
jgi:hypothetical protein